MRPAAVKLKKRRNFMLFFIIGLFVGAFIGIVLMCFCNIASNSDEELDKIHKQNDKNESEE